jgi:hypothetical protein
MQRNSKKSFFGVDSATIDNPYDLGHCVDTSAINTKLQLSVNAGSCLPNKNVSSGYAAPAGAGTINNTTDYDGGQFPGQVPCNPPQSVINSSLNKNYNGYTRGGTAACYGTLPPENPVTPPTDIPKSGQYIDITKQKYIQVSGTPLFTKGSKYSCSSVGNCTTLPNDLNCGNYYTLDAGKCYQFQDPNNTGVCQPNYLRTTINTSNCLVGNTGSINTIQASNVLTDGTSNTITATLTSPTATTSTTRTTTGNTGNVILSSSRTILGAMGNTAGAIVTQPVFTPGGSVTSPVTTPGAMGNTSGTSIMNRPPDFTLTSPVTTPGAMGNTSCMYVGAMGNTAGAIVTQPVFTPGSVTSPVTTTPSTTTPTSSTTTSSTNRTGGVTKNTTKPKVRFNGNVGSKSNFGMTDTTKTTLMIVGAVLLILFLFWYFVVYNKK